MDTQQIALARRLLASAATRFPPKDLLQAAHLEVEMELPAGTLLTFGGAFPDVVLVTPATIRTGAPPEILVARTAAEADPAFPESVQLSLVEAPAAAHDYRRAYRLVWDMDVLQQAQDEIAAAAAAATP